MISKMAILVRKFMTNFDDCSENKSIVSANKIPNSANNLNHNQSDSIEDKHCEDNIPPRKDCDTPPPRKFVVPQLIFNKRRHFRKITFNPTSQFALGRVKRKCSVSFL